LNEDILGDLVYLGEQGNSGDEKGLVLKAINDLAMYMQGADCYQGGELEDLVKGFDIILTGSDKPGNDRNFRTACIILTDIRKRAKGKRMTTFSDAVQAIKALGRLGVKAIGREFEATALEFLEAVSNGSDILFEMGMEALQVKKYLMAIAALNKLEALTDRELPFSFDKTAHLLGLLAHFWDLNGSARLQAQMRISRNRAKFRPALADHLQNAINYHNSMANYETVDALDRMNADIGADAPVFTPKAILR
jgi:tetratricopeptide (TPR) repeat protein